eukprot:5079399-Pyramimonas_sp.AAC.1
MATGQVTLWSIPPPLLSPSDNPPLPTLPVLLLSSAGGTRGTMPPARTSALEAPLTAPSTPRPADWRTCRGVRGGGRE